MRVVRGNPVRSTVTNKFGKMSQSEHWTAVAQEMETRRRRILRLREAGWLNRAIGAELSLTDRQIRYALRRGNA